MFRIYPSLAAASPDQIARMISILEPYCAGFHCDIMDTIFVPNQALDISTLTAINAATTHPLWVHLMVTTPTWWCRNMVLKANSLVSFHIESEEETNKTINCIKEKKWRPSIAIAPKTAIDKTFPYLHLIDQVLIMSVEPGFSGQRFLKSVLPKVDTLVAYKKEHKLSFTIGIDGGINNETIRTAICHSITDIAIGSAIVSKADPVTALKTLTTLAEKKCS